MLITEIKKLDNKRYCLYLDYEPYAAIYTSDIKRMKLCEGAELSDRALQDFERNYLRQRACNKTVNLLKYGDRTEYQIRKLLKESFYSDAVIEYVIKKLHEYSYIDDRRYAAAYINRYIYKKSIPVIRYEMALKGISKELIDEAFNDVILPDTVEIVGDILKKKYTVEYCSENKNKVLGYFLRKGYDYGNVNSAIAEYLK